MVFCHGNGLASDLYYPFWSLLAKDFELIVYDLRNHGQNAVTGKEHHNIPTFINDFECIVKAIDGHYGKKPRVGVFHSISALISLMAPDNDFVAQVLFDPPLHSTRMDEHEFDRAVEHGANMVRQRADRFQTKEEFATFLACLPPFARVVPGGLQLFAEATLRPSREGDYELCCPKDYEAQVLDYMRSFTPLIDWDHLFCPVKVIGSDPCIPPSYLPSVHLDHIHTVDYDFLPESTHLLQVEYPKECARLVKAFLAQNNLL